MNTYGQAITSLTAALREAHLAQAAAYFGTSDYFARSILVAHRAFVRWCRDNGLADPAAVREQLARHVRHHRMPVGTSVGYLFNYIPHEFNVRGVWTP